MGQQESALVVRQEWMSLDGTFILLRGESGVMVAAIIRPRCSARQRYSIIFIVVHVFSIIFLLPHLFLWSCLRMHYCRYLVTDAHVRSAVVVEMNESSDYIPCMLQAVESLSRIDGFRLDYTICTLCDGIVCRVVIFSHAYLDFMCLERLHIVVTTVVLCIEEDLFRR